MCGSAAEEDLNSACPLLNRRSSDPTTDPLDATDQPDHRSPKVLTKNACQTAEADDFPKQRQFHNDQPRPNQSTGVPRLKSGQRFDLHPIADYSPARIHTTYVPPVLHKSIEEAQARSKHKTPAQESQSDHQAGDDRGIQHQPQTEATLEPTCGNASHDHSQWSWTHRSEREPDS